MFECVVMTTNNRGQARVGSGFASMATMVTVDLSNSASQFAKEVHV